VVCTSTVGTFAVAQLITVIWISMNFANSASAASWQVAFAALVVGYVIVV
jgi:hypothetical protein